MAAAPAKHATQIPFLALRDEYERVRDDVAGRFDDVLVSQRFVLGAQTEELEASVCGLTSAAHAVACSSGSDALSLAIAALGIGPGDAVLVPAFTFFATAGAIVRSGATPVFVDVDEGSFNVGGAQIARALEEHFDGGRGRRLHRATGARAKAVIVVHLFGRAAAMREISEVAEAEGLRIVEDAAQAIGAAGDVGCVGAWGDAACFSFYPTKNVGGAGDGGVVTTADGKLAARLRRLRVHGAGEEDLHTECGMNARMGELQAAYVNAKLPFLDEWTAARARVAAGYRQRLAGGDRAGLVLPSPLEPPSHVYHQYVVRIAADREGLRARMSARGIETRVFYPVPLHRQPCFSAYREPTSDPTTSELLTREVLALPIYPSLNDEQVAAVCDALSEAG